MIALLLHSLIRNIYEMAIIPCHKETTVRIANWNVLISHR